LLEHVVLVGACGNKAYKVENKLVDKFAKDEL
jgi:hypothetical protein